MTSLDINIAVGEQISSAGTKITETVIGMLASAEIDRRAQALHKVILAIREDAKALNKLKPDQVGYDEKGAKTSETFSKAVLEDRKKLSEKIAKAEKAIAKATDGGDFSDLFNL